MLVEELAKHGAGTSVGAEHPISLDWKNVMTSRRGACSRLALDAPELAQYDGKVEQEEFDPPQQPRCAGWGHTPERERD